MENKVGQPTNQTTQMGRTVFETPDGQLVSELSKTVIINGAYVNVPSIIDGVEFDEDELVEKLTTGEIRPTSRHNTLEEAEQAAIQRSNNLRIIDNNMNIGGQPQAFTSDKMQSAFARMKEESSIGRTIEDQKSLIEKAGKDVKDVAKGVATSPITATADIVELGGKLPSVPVPSQYQMLQQSLKEASKTINRENAEELLKSVGINLEGTNAELVGEIIGLPNLGALPKLLKGIANKYGVSVNAYAKNVVDELKETLTKQPSEGLAVATAVGKGKPKKLDTVLDTSIMPIMGGTGAKSGKEVQEQYNELISKGKSEKEILEEIRAYKGDDGKLRFDIDDTDMKLKFLEIGNIGKFKINRKSVFYNKKVNIKKGLLKDFVNFPSLYKQYSKYIKKDEGFTFVPIQNLKIEFVSSPKENYAAGYFPDSDTIEVNMIKARDVNGNVTELLDVVNNPVDRATVESNIIHELQHAVQHREGFLKGSGLPQELKKIYKKNNPTASDKALIKAAKKHIDEEKKLQETYNNTIISYLENDLFSRFVLKGSKLDVQLRENIEEVERYIKSKAAGKEMHPEVNRVINNIFKDDAALKQGFDANINDFLGRSSIIKEKEKLSRIENAQLISKLDNLKEITAKAAENYRNVYGEKEARLVEAIRKKRLNKGDVLNQEQFFEAMGEKGARLEYERINNLLFKYEDKNNREALEKAFADPDYTQYKDVLDANLLKMYPNGKIPLERITNYAEVMNQGAKKKIQKTVFDIEDIVFAGNDAERELIVNLNGDLRSFSLPKEEGFAKTVTEQMEKLNMPETKRLTEE